MQILTFNCFSPPDLNLNVEVYTRRGSFENGRSSYPSIYLFKNILAHSIFNFSKGIMSALIPTEWHNFMIRQNIATQC